MSENSTVKTRSLTERFCRTKQIHMASLSQPQSLISKTILGRLTRNSRKRALESVQYENMGTENLAKRRKANVSQDPRSSGPLFRDEILPQNFAFSIEHIFEQIISSLDRKSLFNCRLVSHKWRSVVSAELIKRDDTQLTFEYSSKHRVYVQRRYRSDTPPTPKPTFTLPELTSFLKATYNYDAGASLSIETFPTKKLVFLGGSLNMPQLQSFLNIFGQHIQHLHLDNATRSLSESVLIRRVENLVSVQAPSLSSLILLTYVNDNEAENNEDTETIINIPKNHKLTRLTFGVGSKKIFDKIISISPNLHDVILYSACLHFLLEPVNRLHLLRQFNIMANGDKSLNLENIQMVEAALSSISAEKRQTLHLPPIKFTALCINFSCFKKFLSESEEHRLCIVRVINKILECSWDTLEYISLENYFEETLKGIKWPIVLPKVKKLVLNPSASSELDVFPSNGTFNIQEHFPKLKTLDFNLTTHYFGSISAVEVLKKCNYGPVSSVAFVRANLFVTRVPRSINVTSDAWIALHSFLRNVMRNLFPNAKTEVDVVSSG